MGNINKKLHRWPGVIIAFLLIYFSVTGIVLNHRNLVSSLDVSRELLPQDFHYHHWNNSALKGNLIFNKDSIMVFGELGVWTTDATFKSYRPCLNGFSKGSDNRKVFDLHRTDNGDLYAATQSGLYVLDTLRNQWHPIYLDEQTSRFVAIESVEDTLYILNRSFLFKGKSQGVNSQFEKIELKRPVDDEAKVSLFQTIWQIHSGEIFGLPGKLFVDILGLLTILLSFTGIFYFFFPQWARRRKKKQKDVASLVRVHRWSTKWHNKVGASFIFFFVILFFSGMFLRPPLLIPIAKSTVTPIKYSHLDQKNPWYDRLRDIHYDHQRATFILATSKGVYSLPKVDAVPNRFAIQPPVSVMGINVLKLYKEGAYLIGSFNGLFLWHPSHPEIYNYGEAKPYKGNPSGRPIGRFKVTGLLEDIHGNQYMVDYDKGVVPLYHDIDFPSMPQDMLESSKMSLWNLSLEIHTGRFFRFALGDFYILIVPLSGLVGIMVLISGYLLWRKRHRKPKQR